MSYRELRNFTEMLRALGYPRQISIENFRAPNFKLVAEILSWLLKRYEPDFDIAMELDSEQERTIFIKQAAQFMVQKARIKVNPKKLYQADGYAVQEMLKVASVLYAAILQNQDKLSSNPEDANDDAIDLKTVANAVHSKLNELRVSRKLASDITERGASLFDLLNKEVELREQRSLALARPLELPEVEKSLRLASRAVEEEIKQTLHNLDNIASDEANLDAKIQKKQMDLDRQQKRLAQIQTVRPAYLDEYEKLERELKNLYDIYVQKYRNLAHLEHVFNEYDRAEQERSAEAEMKLRKMAEKMRDEDRARMTQADTAAEIIEHEEERKPQAKMYGNMTGAGVSDDEEGNDDVPNDSIMSDDDEEVVTGAPAASNRQIKPAANADRKVSRDSGGDGLSELSGDETIEAGARTGANGVDGDGQGNDAENEEDSDDNF